MFCIDLKSSQLSKRDLFVSIREASFYKTKFSEVLSMSQVNLSTLYCYLWPNLYSFQNNGFSGESVEAKISELINKKKFTVNDDIQGI